MTNSVNCDNLASNAIYLKQLRANVCVLLDFLSGINNFTACNSSPAIRTNSDVRDSVRRVPWEFTSRA